MGGAMLVAGNNYPKSDRPAIIFCYETALTVLLSGLDLLKERFHG